MEFCGQIIKGHVPTAEIKRLLRERPQWERDPAVAGMPNGSAGME
ncbi:DUF411 domain-containing protein [Croceicoccus sp. Ery15]